MNSNSKDKNKLRDKIFLLMDEVQNHLKKDTNIDNFLDNNFEFENWEKIIPKEQYPIFVIAVLNNIRNDGIINSILDSIIEEEGFEIKSFPKRSNKKLRSSYGEHPFS